MTRNILDAINKIIDLLNELQPEEAREVLEHVADIALEDTLKAEQLRREQQKPIPLSELVEKTNPPVTGKRMVPVAEAARILKIQKRSVYSRIYTGSMKSIKRKGVRYVEV